jgi:hypothetical protein
MQVVPLPTALASSFAGNLPEEKVASQFMDLSYLRPGFVKVISYTLAAKADGLRNSPRILAAISAPGHFFDLPKSFHYEHAKVLRQQLILLVFCQRSLSFIIRQGLDV